MKEIRVRVNIHDLHPKLLRDAMVKAIRENVVEDMARSLEAEGFAGEAGRVATALCKDLATHLRRWDPDASPLPAATGRA